MTKSEQKKAVQYTRMCKFWKSNECKMGAECTFAHSTIELRPSPKPCFEFTKNGFCTRGPACRFVHDTTGAKNGKSSTVQQIPMGQQGQHGQHGQDIPFPLLAGPLLPSLSSLAAQLAIPQIGQMAGPLMEPDLFPKAAKASVRPPPGLEHVGMNVSGFDLDPMPKISSQQMADADSRRSSSSDLSMGLQGVSLPISSKAADLDRSWALDEATVATKSLTSTMCMSATPSSFSESTESPQATSFWL